jgi:hypothetical protein
MQNAREQSHRRYVSGVAGMLANGTDGFAAISASLKAAGTRMNLVLNCTCFFFPNALLSSFFSFLFFSFLFFSCFGDRRSFARTYPAR